MSARMIENHWLTDDYRNVMRVHFHSRVEFIGTLMEGVRGVSDAIAHDLRTPIARARAKLEEALATAGDPTSTAGAALRAAVEQGIADLDNISRIFQALLRIAEACRAPASSLLPLEHQGRAAPTSSLPPPVTDFGPVRLELMGHRYREGGLSEVVIAGTPFLRLDPEGGASEFYRPDAVYCITPGLSPPPVARTAIPARFGDVDDDDTWSNDDE